MNSLIWDCYNRMQSEVYGTTVSIKAVDDNQITPIKLYHIIKDPSDVLILGPGGRNEVLSWRKRVNGRVEVLTIHPRELSEFNDLDVIGKVGDIHDLPYQSCFFDIVFSSQVFEHSISPYVALMECRRVLREGGYLMMTVPSFDGPDNGLNETHISCLEFKHWRELLRKTGFCIIAETIENTTTNAEYLALLCQTSTLPPLHQKALSEVRAIKG